MDMENEWEKKTNIGFASVATMEGETGLLKKLLLLLAAALSRYCIDRFSDQERERERDGEGGGRRGDGEEKRGLKIISYPVLSANNITISLKSIGFEVVIFTCSKVISFAFSAFRREISICTIVENVL